MVKVSTLTIKKCGESGSRLSKYNNNNFLRRFIFDNSQTKIQENRKTNLERIRLLLRREGERAHYKSEVLHHLIVSKSRAHWV